MNRKSFRLVALILFITIAFGLLNHQQSAATATTDSLTKELDLQFTLAPHAQRTHTLKTNRSQPRSLLVSLPSPAKLGAQESLSVTLADAKQIIAQKSLHLGDADLYLTFQSDSAPELKITSNADQPIPYSVSVNVWPAPQSGSAQIETEPNNSWQSADAFELGQTVWASADDQPYIQALNETANGAAAYQAEKATDRVPTGGEDWFTFTFNESAPKLIHFEIDLLERDNIPVDVSVFTVENNALKPYERGADPVTPPHEVQALPGNKFTTRVIAKGTYYVRVNANHPFYQLRTSVYDLPPYTDPRQAVRAGMDYLVSAGDSWHANTPRHGGIVNRVSTPHHETQLCIACHATHFTTRGELTAAANGYAVNKRASLQFLTERLANNPLPFYGHKDASWTRVISASANVLSRLAMLVTQYDDLFTGEQKTPLLKGVANYLKLYYKGRTALPNDETNGNTPLVSAYEVAWYSWKVFDTLAARKADAEAASYRDQLRKLIEEDRIKNTIDLCYQTIALVEIDRTAYAERIKRNAERLLALQRADGQWSMLLDPNSVAVEFQTGHSLYALARAGYTPDHPQIKKGVDYLLARQQEFGGWFDPRQSYENFRTPFRETQFAVMALSQLYQDKAGIAELHRDKRRIELLPQSTIEKLGTLSGTWRAVFIQHSEILMELRTAEPLTRAVSAAALGRVGFQTAIRPLSALLNDPSKLVQIAAAQAVHRITAREHVVPPSGGIGLATNAIPPKGGTTYLAAAFTSPNERTRWAATRIFAQHFSALTRQPQFADKLIAALNDKHPLVRMQAAKSLTQWFYWAKDTTLKDHIADAFITQLSQPQHPWVQRNLREGLYSMADENVRYLYNNWIALLATAADRAAAKAGQRAESRAMAERIARALTNGNATLRENLLRGLTEFHLRHSGYNNAARYTRIGNDVETIQFYDEGARTVEKALAPLIAKGTTAQRQQALLLSYTVRDQQLDALPLLVMQQLNDGDATIRAAAQEVYKLLPLQVREQNKQAAIAVLKALLASPHAPAQTAALERVKAIGATDARAAQLDVTIRDFVLRADRRVAPTALLALADFPALKDDAEIQQRLAAALKDDALQRAAAQLALYDAQWRTPPAIKAALHALLTMPTNTQRRMLLGHITEANAKQFDLPLLALLAQSFADKEDATRAAAMSAVRRVPALLKEPQIKTGLARMMNDANPALQEQAVALYQSLDNHAPLYFDNAQAIAHAAATTTNATATTLDYGFFVQRVIPLLARKGADGQACVNCHATHAIFKLIEPDAQGRFSEEALRENYRYAVKVSDTKNPENSLLLRKPLGDASQEGVVNARRTPHGGGQRWQGTTDPAYQTVLDWLNGTRLTTNK
jgi:hypothetical protein